MPEIPSSNQSRTGYPESIGRYRLIRRLGEGGMGSVFLAFDTILEREIALKLPLTGTENDPEVRSRFLREARSAATLDHPYICRVYDADEVDGRPYMAMAYIEGKSLADLVRAEGIPPRQVVALVGKLAIAMNQAHLKGVVHRDLKPRNVMIRREAANREPVIVDFGLARLQSSEDVRMTRTGEVMGTPAYMSPEQLRGNPDEIGPACDIYALGVILYELLTGRLPFSGPYPVMVTQILTKSPAPPSTHRPGLDPTLDAICLKALAKEVSARHATMMELATSLTGYLRGATIAVVPDQLDSRVSRPIESDSIPTGINTLVSRLLGKSKTSETLPGLAIDLDSRPDLQTAGFDSGSSVSRADEKSSETRPAWVMPTIAGLFTLLVLGGVVSLARYIGGSPGTQRANLPAVGRTSPTPSTGKTPEVKKIDPTPKTPSTPVETPAPPKVDLPLLENKLGMKFRLIPSGEFQRGAGDDEPNAQDDEKPRHRVRIARPFYLGVYEVTQKEYQSVMDVNPSYFSAQGSGSQQVVGLDTSQFPVENVTLFDAVEFCNKLSEREGLLPCYLSKGEPIAGGTGYRLPTEAEWEYACRARTSTAYAFGEKLEPTMANFLAAPPEAGSTRGAPLKRPVPVGRYPPNGFGLYDMHGNVAEWTSDWYDAAYYARKIVDDPHAGQVGPYWVFRGGSWVNKPAICRSAKRDWVTPAGRGSTLGFRVLRVSTGS